MKIVEFKWLTQWRGRRWGPWPCHRARKRSSPCMTQSGGQQSTCPGHARQGRRQGWTLQRDTTNIWMNELHIYTHVVPVATIASPRRTCALFLHWIFTVYTWSWLWSDFDAVASQDSWLWAAKGEDIASHHAMIFMAWFYLVPQQFGTRCLSAALMMRDIFR